MTGEGSRQIRRIEDALPPPAGRKLIDGGNVPPHREAVPDILSADLFEPIDSSRAGHDVVHTSHEIPEGFVEPGTKRILFAVTESVARVGDAQARKDLTKTLDAMYENTRQRENAYILLLKSLLEQAPVQQIPVSV